MLVTKFATATPPRQAGVSLPHQAVTHCTALPLRMKVTRCGARNAGQQGKSSAWVSAFQTGGRVVVRWRSVLTGACASAIPSRY